MKKVYVIHYIDMSGNEYLFEKDTELDAMDELNDFICAFGGYGFIVPEWKI